ncbi:MAG: hypothetical protein M3Q03_00395 [Chloroflexota bacterium]|nr:hypothetical protein [Chloroflexota bacterium]
MAGFIDELYVAVQQTNGGDLDHRGAVAVALFDFARLVRESYPGSAHSAVPELVDEPFCEGDVILDRVLWRYFQAVLLSREGDADRHAASFRILADLARQSACLGTRQLFDLDLALSVAWIRLTDRLNERSLSLLESWLAPVVLQVRLVVYDATKHLGLESPGFHWLKSQVALRDALARRPVWPVDQRLWVYDRRAAAIVAVRTTCDDGGVGSDCINPAVLVDSLITPHYMGLGECSLLEMLEAGVRDVNGAPGYTCSPGLCATPIGGFIPDTELAGSFLAMDESLMHRVALPHEEGVAATPFGLATPFGIGMAEARASICGAGGLGGLGGGLGGGGICGAGAGGIGRANATIACLMQVHQSPVTELHETMSCVGRTMGSCPSVDAPLHEAMNPIQYGGVPGCQLAQDGGTDAGTDSAAADIKQQAQERADEYQQNPAAQETVSSAIESATGVRPTDAQYQQALQKLSEAKPVSSVAGGTANAATDDDGNIIVDASDWNTRSEESQNRTLDHEFIHSVVNIMAKEGSIAPTTEEEDQEIMRRTGIPLDANLRCAQDSPECGNQCGGMSEQMRQAMACMAPEPELAPREPEPIDPLPDDVGGSEWATCLESGNQELTVANRLCSQVLCADPSAGYVSGTGACCQPGGISPEQGRPDHQGAICGFVLCAATIGRVDLGVCGCGGSFAPRATIEPVNLISVESFDFCEGIPEPTGCR